MVDFWDSLESLKTNLFSGTLPFKPGPGKGVPPPSHPRSSTNSYAVPVCLQQDLAQVKKESFQYFNHSLLEYDHKSKHDETIWFHFQCKLP